jgi:hypothetical protein
MDRCTDASCVARAPCWSGAHKSSLPNVSSRSRFLYVADTRSSDLAPQLSGTPKSLSRGVSSIVSMAPGALDNVRILGASLDALVRGLRTSSQRPTAAAERCLHYWHQATDPTLSVFALSLKLDGKIALEVNAEQGRFVLPLFHAFALMSNHLHMQVTNLPTSCSSTNVFTEIAKAMNAPWGHHGQFGGIHGLSLSVSRRGRRGSADHWLRVGDFEKVRVEPLRSQRTHHVCRSDDCAACW